MSGQEQKENKQGKAVRERTFKVRLSESEYQLLDSNNPYGSIAKLLRQAAIEKATKIHNSKAEDEQKIKAKKVVESSYSKTERALILELGRIGNNVNQIAKAINTAAITNLMYLFIDYKYDLILSAISIIFSADN